MWPAQAVWSGLSRLSVVAGSLAMMPCILLGATCFSTGQSRRRTCPLSFRHWASPSPLNGIVTMNERRINLHLVSEATGETLNTLARATTAQFESAHIITHRWSLIRTSFQLHRVLEGIETEPGPVLSTLVDHALRSELETMCLRTNLPVANVLDPVMNVLQDYIGDTAAHRPGLQ